MTSFEVQIQRLEEIVKILDRGDEPISNLLDLYEEGMDLVAKCRDFLNSAEQRINLVGQDYSTTVSGEKILDPF